MKYAKEKKKRQRTLFCFHHHGGIVVHSCGLELVIRRGTRRIDGYNFVLQRGSNVINIMRRQVIKNITTRQEELAGWTRMIGKENIGKNRFANVVVVSLHSLLGGHVRRIESTLETATKMNLSLGTIVKQIFDLTGRFVDGFFGKDRYLGICRLSNQFTMSKGGRGQDNAVEW